MKNIDPAFPVPTNFQHAGMTLRDYFAAKALPAVLAASQGTISEVAREASKTAYMIADAMIAEREVGAK